MTEFGSDLILARLQTLHPKSIDLSLDRLQRLLDRLGHPERCLPPTIHIAGTNGKGSTLAMLDAMLKASGRRVHRYISPHLVKFNERILLHGVPIDEQLLAACLDECERLNGDAPITFFEITTAAAFLAFARVPAEFLLLETGLGGRLDATNVVERPILSLISPISLDHEGYLGGTVELIAAEKAGIIKAGVPVIAGPQTANALEVLDSKANELNTHVRAAGRDWSFELPTNGLRLIDHDDRVDLPSPVLAGTYQFENAALAAMAGRFLGLETEAIRSGICRADWSARLQRLKHGPLVDVLPTGSELWLDGGHNPAAGLAVASSLPEIAADRPIHLVLGMLSTKNVGAFAGPLAPLATSVRTVPVPDEPSSRDPTQTAACLRDLGCNATPASSFDDAVRALAAEAPGPALILICGSLYLAGQVLRNHG